MATLDDILTLARAGFNAEQIGALLQPAQAPAPQPDPQPAPQPEPQPAPQPEAAQPDPYQQLMQELGAIKAQIQQSNRSQAQQPEAQQLTGEQILANIIAPPKRSS